MAGPARARPPLGLPSGSVRALLTLLITAAVIVQVVRNQNVAPLWVETLMIALAHYFTSRRFINLPTAALAQLQKDGFLEEESNPLYLPRHSIRVIIVLAFLGMAVYVYREHALLDTSKPALSILGVICCYLLGILTRGLLSWWTKGSHSEVTRSWEDGFSTILADADEAGASIAGHSETNVNTCRLSISKNSGEPEDAKALVVLALMAFTATVDFLNRADLVPEAVRNVSLGLVLFYFGSR